jgi:hypothetical protein
VAVLEVAEGLPATVYEMLPFPVPDVADVMVTQLWFTLAVQWVDCLLGRTCTELLSPAAEMFMELGLSAIESANTQGDTAMTPPIMKAARMRKVISIAFRICRR